jgi:alanine-synthesizing transaminase
LDHVRIVTLPHKDQLHDAVTRITTFLDGYRQR